jgi:hypothetical protein
MDRARLEFRTQPMQEGEIAAIVDVPCESQGLVDSCERAVRAQRLSRALRAARYRTKRWPSHLDPPRPPATAEFRPRRRQRHGDGRAPTPHAIQP